MKAGNLTRAYFKNIAQAALGRKHTLDTMVATYYVTSMCNFRCDYCEHFSADLNHLVKDKQADTAGSKRIMEVIRKDCDVLYLTGGEPLLRNDIEELCRHARALDFAYLSLNTNGLLLSRREGVLDSVDNVVISLDSLDTSKLDRIYGVGRGTAQKVLDTIAHYAQHKQGRTYLLTVNCVVTPETVDEAEAVMEFCFAHGAEFSVSPQNRGVKPHPGLVGNPSYRRFMERLIEAKRAGKPVSGARIYYEHMAAFTPFQCYPTLTARIDPEGNVSFPCRPLDEQGLIGGKAGNLLETGSLRAVQDLGRQRFGERIPCHDQCYMRCHAELSLLVKNPSKLFYETTSYLARTLGRGKGLRPSEPSSGEPTIDPAKV